MTFDFTNRHKYRKETGTGLAAYSVSYKYADLFIQTNLDLSEIAEEALKKYYDQIQNFVRSCPEFEYSLVPVKCPADAPDIIKDMTEASRLAGVGPFAAVAGVVAEYVGRELLEYSDTVFAENGGDIFLHTKDKCSVAIYAGNSPLSMRSGLVLPSGSFGVCTSSGRIGHSRSFGKAHTAVCVSKNTALADSCATLLGNLVKTPQDISDAINRICGIDGIIGAVCIIDEHIGFSGDLELIEARG